MCGCVKLPPAVKALVIDVIAIVIIIGVIIVDVNVIMVVDVAISLLWRLSSTLQSSSYPLIIVIITLQFGGYKCTSGCIGVRGREGSLTET